MKMSANEDGMPLSSDEYIASGWVVLNVGQSMVNQPEERLVGRNRGEERIPLSGGGEGEARGEMEGVSNVHSSTQSHYTI